MSQIKFFLLQSHEWFIKTKKRFPSFPSSRGLRALLGSTELLYLFCKQCTESEFCTSKINYLITIKDFLIVQTEGTRQVERAQKFYNLDVIISVGYRVKSIRGTQFRIWATERLREYPLSPLQHRHPIYRMRFPVLC